MKKVIIFAGLLLLLALGSGCADFKTYMKDRGNDFADCFKGDVGYGFGAGAHVRVTELFSAGAGGGYMWKYGFKGRRTGKWTDILLGWPVANVIFAFDVMPEMFGGSTFGNNGSDKVFGFLLLIPMNDASVGRLAAETEGNPPGYETEFFRGGFSTHSILGLNLLALERAGPDIPEGLPATYKCPAIETFDIEVGVMAGLVGVHFGFSPGQFVDFLCGWFGLDMMDDDIRSKPAAAPPATISP